MEHSFTFKCVRGWFEYHPQNELRAFLCMEGVTDFFQSPWIADLPEGTLVRFTLTDTPPDSPSFQPVELSFYPDPPYSPDVEIQWYGFKDSYALTIPASAKIVSCGFLPDVIYWLNMTVL